jgi:hypothetical protein
MNVSLHMFAGVFTGAIAVALVIALVLMVVYALDRAAFDKQLDEMKASATTMADRRGDE